MLLVRNFIIKADICLIIETKKSHNILVIRMKKGTVTKKIIEN
jgi:hypothetical protein